MTYIKVDIKPKSINQLRKENSDLFYNQTWYDKEKFATTKPKAQTLWVRTNEVPASRNLSWDMQQECLLRGDEVPTANTLIQAIIQHYKKTGERLFSYCYVSTRDVASVGFRVRLGYFDADGLRVFYSWDDRRVSGLGLASSRKLEPGVSNLETLEHLESLPIEVLIDGIRYVPEVSK